MIKRTLKNITKYPLIILFTLSVLVMFAGFIAGESAKFSELENRTLAQLPKVSLANIMNGSFMGDFEKYTEDQLPLRNKLIKVKSVCEELLFKCENNGIIRGKDGYLFEKAVKVNPQLHKNISAIDNFAKALNRTVYVAIAPNSNCVYEDKLPVGAPVLDEKMAEEELVKALDDNDNAVVIDLYKAVVNGDYESEYLYYRTDHHWTTVGAYKAYVELAKVMGFDAIEIDAYGLNSVDDFYGTYYAKYKGTGIRPDEITYSDIPVISYMADDKLYNNLLDMDKLCEYDKYGMFMYGNPGKAVIKGAGSNNGRKLVVLKDSYANSVLPYLAASYDEIEVLDLRYLGESVQSIIRSSNEADILLLYNWSFVNDDNHFYKMVK